MGFDRLHRRDVLKLIGASAVAAGFPGALRAEPAAAPKGVAFIEGASGKIAYRQSTGTGRAIILVHGNSMSSRSFVRQLDGPLGQKRRLIAIDLPGHGESANATGDTVYNLPGYARTVVDLAKRLGVEDAVFAGHSLGGHIVLEAAPNLPKAAGFVVFGTPPLAFPPAMDKAFLPNPAMNVGFAGEITKEQAQAYLASWFKPGTTDIAPSFLDDLMRTDGRARTQLGASIVPDGYRDEIEVVAKLKQPLAVLHGADDQLINGGYFASLTMPTLWRGSVQTIANSGHTPQWEQAAQFDALIDAFG
ncbi:MAG: alpha/beta fold hydrolase [Xanthobacteraceae bacterium]|nr:alpha/beta fold hydrolase [Xanthobacteraceae bacterium]